MSTMERFLRAARQDRPVYIGDVRDAFQREGTRPFHIHVRLYDGRVRRFALKLPRCQDEGEAAFAASYLNATLYNILSALGAREITICLDRGDAPLLRYAEGLNDLFQTDVPIALRSGYGKCLNVNQRTLRSLCGRDVRFAFKIADLAGEPGAPGQPRTGDGSADFAAIPKRAERGMLLGMDIGGTDVKVVAALNGRLCALKEFDWSPSEFTRAEQLIEPICLLARLMRSAACMQAQGLGAQVPGRAFDRSAGMAQMRAAAEDMERALGEELRGFDGIGLCFPDVVIRNRIVGGETPKTRGMRENRALDYETQFARITDLCDALRPYARPGAPVVNTNDGPMAAFTTAVEMAAAGKDLSAGFFAHTLGTDLGAGWILPDGTIPEIPLEVYNFIIDLGSSVQRRYDPRDVRSVRNFGTHLPGTLQKYTGQFGVFRMAAKTLPDADPALYRRAFEEGLFRREGERLIVPTAPRDMRKPCLEFFMRAAAEAASPAAELFRAVGECVAVTWRETQFILELGCAVRTLFGRLVKTQACFDEMREGARRVVPDIRLEVADETLANTPLMRQLAGHPVYTVAQFAQAVGAIHYACLGMK